MIEIVAQEKEVVSRDGLGKVRSPSSVRLAIGDIVTARVLSKSAPHQAVVLIDGQKMQARTHGDIKTGEVLALKISALHPLTVKRLRTGGGPLLRTGLATLMADTAADPYAVLYKALTSRSGSKSTHGPLLPLLTRLADDIHRQGGDGFLGRILDGSGLLWERKLRDMLGRGRLRENEMQRMLATDLKAALCRSIAARPDPDHRLLTLLRCIENIQLFNRPQSGTAAERHIFIPLPLQAAPGQMPMSQLLLRVPGEKSPRGGDAGGRGFSMTFLLNLSRLGPIRIDAAVFAKRVNCRFLTVREDVRREILEQAKTLARALEGRGFVFQNLACRVRPVETVARSLLAEYVGGEPEQLHITA